MVNKLQLISLRLDNQNAFAKVLNDASVLLSYTKASGFFLFELSLNLDQVNHSENAIYDSH